MVESNIVLFRPLCEVLDSVLSLHIQWYSCCFSHCSLFSSVVGAWVRMCMVIFVYVFAYGTFFVCKVFY